MELTTGISTQEITKPFAGAAFLPRMGAQIIDLLLHNVLLVTTAYANGLIMGVLALLMGISSAHLTAKLEGSKLIMGVGALAGYILYHTLCEGLHGATLGKLILRVYVRQEDGSPCKVGPAFLRSLAFLVDSMFLGAMAAISMNSSELKQRLGDKWAHTVVVEHSKLNENQRPSGRQFLLVLLLGVIADAGLYAALMWAVVAFG